MCCEPHYSQLKHTHTKAAWKASNAVKVCPWKKYKLQLRRWGAGGETRWKARKQRVNENAPFRKQTSSGAIYGVRMDEYAMCYGWGSRGAWNLTARVPHPTASGIWWPDQPFAEHLLCAKYLTHSHLCLSNSTRWVLSISTFNGESEFREVMEFLLGIRELERGKLTSTP